MKATSFSRQVRILRMLVQEELRRHRKVMARMVGCPVSCLAQRRLLKHLAAAVVPFEAMGIRAALVVAVPKSATKMDPEQEVLVLQGKVTQADWVVQITLVLVVAVQVASASRQILFILVVTVVWV